MALVGRPLSPITLSPELCEQLKSMANSRSLPHALVTRARIIVMANEGMNNKSISQKTGFCFATVSQWRRRFIEQGFEGLYDEPRPGGPRLIKDEQIARLIKKTLNTKPGNGTHWSCRSIAGETKLSKSTVHRVWRAFGIQPHRQKHFKLSTDPFFVEKVRDIVGLYLNAG